MLPFLAPADKLELKPTTSSLLDFRHSQRYETWQPVFNKMLPSPALADKLDLNSKDSDSGQSAKPRPLAQGNDSRQGTKSTTAGKRTATAGRVPNPGPFKGNDSR